MYGNENNGELIQSMNQDACTNNNFLYFFVRDMSKRKNMFEWLYSIFRRSSDSESNMSNLLDGGEPMNILLVTNQKDKLTSRLLNNIIRENNCSGSIFTSDNQYKILLDTNKLPQQYTSHKHSIDKLDSFLLGHKATLETYDMPMGILIFDSFENLVQNTHYQDLLKTNKQLNFTTITATDRVDSGVMLDKMDKIIIIRNKRRNRQLTTMKAIWSNFSNYRTIPLDKFKNIASNKLAILLENRKIFKLRVRNECVDIEEVKNV